MKYPKKRKELLSFLESLFVDFKVWKHHFNLGRRIKIYGSFWSLLKSGVPFEVYSDVEYAEKVLSDGDHFWVYLPTVYVDNDSSKKGLSFRFSVKERELFTTINKMDS
jgi:hypothetical protein